METKINLDERIAPVHLWVKVNPTTRRVTLHYCVVGCKGVRVSVKVDAKTKLPPECDFFGSHYVPAALVSRSFKFMDFDRIDDEEDLRFLLYLRFLY